MTGDCHVRFCERLGVKFPLPTRLYLIYLTICKFTAKRSIFFKMAQYNELPVYKATYDLLLEMFRFTKDFSKKYKYTVGESLIRKNLSDHPFTAQHIWQTHKASTFTP